MPPEDKLSQFITYMQNLGFNVGELSRNPESPAVYADLLSGAEERGILTPVSYTLLRTMSKARYSEIHHSHFGLGIENYCHFTSPIRRLSDLATHRIIKRVLISGKRGEAYASFARRCAVAATEGELRAVSAERRIENLYKALYMSHFVGEEFDAVISGVTEWGFYAEINENKCEGMIPMRTLQDDYYEFDEANYCIIGRRRKRKFTIGDPVRIRITRANLDRKQLDFELVDE
jgi:ribonuclease R